MDTGSKMIQGCIAIQTDLVIFKTLHFVSALNMLDNEALNDVLYDSILGTKPKDTTVQYP